MHVTWAPQYICGALPFRLGNKVKWAKGKIQGTTRATKYATVRVATTSFPNCPVGATILVFIGEPTRLVIVTIQKCNFLTFRYIVAKLSGLF